MAARKETLWQADFSFGEVRPEAVERDDTNLIEQSLSGALNTYSLATGQTEARPGLVDLSSTTSKRGFELDLGEGRVFELHITPTGLVVYDSAGTAVFTEAATDWTAVANKFGTYTFDEIRFWVLSDPDTASVLIGAQKIPLYGLIRSSAGTWSFGAASFGTTLDGALAQPYWRYYPSVTIQPSARSGAITVTASSGIWTAAMNGMRIRYVGREILLGSLVSSTVINATVKQRLPPTNTITVAASTNYEIGDAVEHSILGGQGIITGISGADITVLATSSYDGFDAVASPKLVAPNAAQVISAVVAASPAASFLWDMQIQSPVHGYAGWGARHQGRAFLCDFPGAPMAFAASAAGSVADFAMGVNDADGFVESLGSDRGGALKYIISAEDLLFMTTKGLYYQTTRDQSAITPSTIAPVPFSRIGCAAVDPVVVDDGCVFVDGVGKQIFSAMLAGDVYKSWRVESLARFHSHLASTPVFLGATSYGSEGAEQFIYAVKADGTAAVCQWDRQGSIISWRPWATEGLFKAIYQCFGKTYALVERSLASVTTTRRERFEFGMYVDSGAFVRVSDAFPAGETGVALAQGVTRFATHMNGHRATVYMEGWDLGDRLIDASGKPLDGDGNILVFPDYDGVVQIGLPFEVTFVPWPRRSARTQRGTREVKKIVSLFVTVQATGAFMIGDEPFGGYMAGEVQSVPPPFRNEQYKVTLVGADAYERLPITKDRPGPFRLLKLGYRVVI